MDGKPLEIMVGDLPDNWEELYRQGYYPENTRIILKEDFSIYDLETDQLSD